MSFSLSFIILFLFVWLSALLTLLRFFNDGRALLRVLSEVVLGGVDLDEWRVVRVEGLRLLELVTVAHVDLLGLAATEERERARPAERAQNNGAKALVAEVFGRVTLKVASPRGLLKSCTDLYLSSLSMVLRRGVKGSAWTMAVLSAVIYSSSRPSASLGS